MPSIPAEERSEEEEAYSLAYRVAWCLPGKRPFCVLGRTCQCTIKKTAIHSSAEETPPIVGYDALLALANWIERRRHHDPTNALQDLATRAPGSATSAHCPAESDGHPAPGQDHASGGDAL